MEPQAIATIVGSIFASFGAMLVYMKKQGFFDNRRDTFIEYLEAVRQSGKQESSDLVADITKKLDSYHDENTQNQARMHEKLNSIDTHVEKLAGKITKNKEDIYQVREDVAVLKSKVH